LFGRFGGTFCLYLQLADVRVDAEIITRRKYVGFTGRLPGLWPKRVLSVFFVVSKLPAIFRPKINCNAIQTNPIAKVIRTANFQLNNFSSSTHYRNRRNNLYCCVD
jgi:hypothetical protein